jgi:hypothetical protein
MGSVSTVVFGGTYLVVERTGARDCTKPLQIVL